MCVDPIASYRVRRSEDLTTDRMKEKDAFFITWLTGQLRRYLPQLVDQTHAAWTRLPHLAFRREERFVATQLLPGAAPIGAAAPGWGGSPNAANSQRPLRSCWDAHDSRQSTHRQGTPCVKPSRHSVSPPSR